MNSTVPDPFTQDLRTHLALCQEALALAASENQALNQGAEYHPGTFDTQRKGLLPRLEQSLIALREWRHRRPRLEAAERGGDSQADALLQAVQSLLMRVLLLDRENQQALLRRGLLPAQHLPAATVQQPHCVADLYRRHARG